MSQGKEKEACVIASLHLGKYVYCLCTAVISRFKFVTYFSYFSRPLSPPSKPQARLIRQIIASGFLDHVARRWPKTLRIDEDDAINHQKLGGAYQCSQVMGFAGCVSFTKQTL